MPLPGGGVAEVNLDFNVLRELGEVARSYGLAGAVQHGASTLPDRGSLHSPAVETAEIHLATGFQNAPYDHPAFPAALKDEIPGGGATPNAADERKDGQTEEQFLYTTRKKAIGPFKRQLWELPTKDEILASQAAKLSFLFTELRVNGTLELVQRYIQPVPVRGRSRSRCARRSRADDRGRRDRRAAGRLGPPRDAGRHRRGPGRRARRIHGPRGGRIVDRIRDEAPEGWLSLVAVDAAGTVVGHLLMSPCPVEDDAGATVAT